MARSNNFQFYQGLLLLLWCFTGPLPVCESSLIGGTVDLPYCHDLMHISDGDSSGCLDREEFFDMTLVYDEDGIYDGVTLATVPDYWNRTWLGLLDVCHEQPAWRNCSGVNNGCVNLNDEPPEGQITNPPELYIFTVCWSIGNALKHSKDSAAPSSTPSEIPTSQPSTTPSSQPSTVPSSQPTQAPSRSPTEHPSGEPSSLPTLAPTIAPSSSPSSIPTQSPSLLPTSTFLPTFAPSVKPTQLPTSAPTPPPTLSPSISPTTTLQPTAAPTQPPSWSPSASPSQSPTQQPTGLPTKSPTLLPSLSPSSSPTVSMRPTSSPTVSAAPTFTAPPTAKPSAPPSSSPTLSRPPSDAPTGKPTHSPSMVPSTQPSIEPTLSPSEFPSLLPSQSPSLSPREISETMEVTLAFQNDEEGFQTEAAATQDANLVTFYSNSIIGCTDTVIDATAGGFRRRRLGQSIQRPCEMTGDPVSITCPVPPATDDDVCRTFNLTCFYHVTGPDAERSSDIADSFRDAWSTAMQEGEYQKKLDDITQTGRILYISGQNIASKSAISKTNATLTTAVTGSIVTGAIVAVMLPFMLLLFHRSRSQEDEKQKVYYEPYEAEDAPSEMESEVMGSQLFPPQSSAMMPPPPRGLSVLGASRPSYGMTKATQKYLEDVESGGEDILAEPEFDAERDSSSNAGSSGWSSSAGYSSYNTGSMDDSMDAAIANGTTLAAIGVTSSLSKNHDSGRSSVSDGRTSVSADSSSPSISRDQLDSFIEAGDWAAVGATAALLAAASDSQSASSASRSRRSRASSYGSDSLEAARAAELDHLVDAGDWEGVVLAAARFEAAEMTVSSRGSRTASSVDSTGSQTHTDDGGATGSSPSQSESATGSDDPSRARQRREVRAEVEALVRRVVPEEIDNVDEMINQFKGREEELVETLRTMQERAIAQKARSAGHKTAKLEARKNVKRGVVPGARPPPVLNQPAAQRQQQRQLPPAPPPRPSPPPIQIQQSVPPSIMADGLPPNSEPKSRSSSSQSASISDSNDSSTLGSLQETRTALENAIDAGDWEAVGKAAAFLSDGSVGTSETGEIERTANSNVSTTSGSTRTRQTKDSETAVRAAELDEMINRGDWSGVVAAANRFSQMDRNAKSEMGRTAEEEEALAQAEFWTKIANQKKAQGANDVGASDAAEWAIQRSLSQMKEADRKKDASPNKEDEEDEV